MFGIGAQEMVLIGLLFLVIFGPGKSTEMARELGRLSRRVRGSIDEFRSELECVEHEDSEAPEYYTDYSIEEDLEPEGVRRAAAAREPV